MTLESSAHASRLRVIARAQALRNASQACGEFGISHTLFYRWRRRGRPPTLSVEAERAILSLAYPGASPLEHAAGPARVRGLVGEPQHGVPRVAPGRAGHPPGTPRCPGAPQRRSAGLLTERTRRALGKLKGVGKGYQYTACDVASAYAIAQVSTEFSAAAARFLTTRVLPAYQAAGWPAHHVRTDWGSEYRRPCRAPSCTSCGAWSSTGASSPRCSSCRQPCIAPWSFTTPPAAPRLPHPRPNTRRSVLGSCRKALR